MNANQVVPLLEALCNALIAKQMMELLGRKGAAYFNRKTIRPMITDEVIALVKVESKTSSRQRYYLTKKGFQLLAKLKSE